MKILTYSIFFKEVNMFFMHSRRKKKKSYRDLLKRRRKKINTINRQEFIESIQSTGKIDNLLVTLERMEKLVDWQREVKNFFFVLVKPQYENIIIDVIESIKQEFFEEGKHKEVLLSDEGFFLFNLVCFSGTTIDQAMRYYEIVRIIFVIFTVIVFLSLFFFKSLESIWFILSVLLVLALYIAIYRYFCLRIRFELINSFVRIKEAMLKASLQLAKSIIRGVDTAIEYQEEMKRTQQDLRIADNILLLMALIGNYDLQTKAINILESDGSTESVAEIENARNKIVPILTCEKQVLDDINSAKGTSARQEPTDSSSSNLRNLDLIASNGNNYRGSENIETLLDTLLHSINLKSKSTPNHLQHYFHLRQVSRMTKELLNSFEIDKMGASDRVRAFATLKDILGELKMPNPIQMGDVNFNIDRSTIGGVSLTGDVRDIVVTAINELPQVNNSSELSIKELLSQLEQAAKNDRTIPQEAVKELLDQIVDLASSAKNPKDKESKNLATKSIEFLKKCIKFLPEATNFVKAFSDGLPLLGKYFGIPI